MSFCSSLRSCLKGQPYSSQWREEEAEPLVSLVSGHKIIMVFLKTLKCWRITGLLQWWPCAIPPPESLGCVCFLKECNFAVYACKVWSRRKMHADFRAPSAAASSRRVLAGFRPRHSWLGLFVDSGQMNLLWMANWIPPSRKAGRCEALSSHCFLSVWFGPLPLSSSCEKSLP